jgi:hypothetical protein
MSLGDSLKDEELASDQYWAGKKAEKDRILKIIKDKEVYFHLLAPSLYASIIDQIEDKK